MSVVIFNQKEVIDFFEMNNLVPGSIDLISDRNDYLKIIFSAKNKSEMFGRFVRESLVSVSEDEYFLNFETWEELLNCYYSFATGFTKCDVIASA
jgi:hypothetical protein